MHSYTITRSIAAVILAILLPVEASSQVASPDDVLYRGRIFTPQAYPPDNHPFFMANRWMKGSIVLDEQTFTGVLMRYDLKDSEIQLNLPLATRSVFIKPHPERIGSFRLNNHPFVHVGQADSLVSFPGTGFYEILYEDQVKLLKKHSKLMRQNASGAVDFYGSNEVYIVKRDKWTVVRKRKDVLDALSDREDEIRTYLRNNRIYIRNAPDRQLIAVVSHYCSLK